MIVQPIVFRFLVNFVNYIWFTTRHRNPILGCRATDSRRVRSHIHFRGEAAIDGSADPAGSRVYCQDLRLANLMGGVWEAPTGEYPKADEGCKIDARY